MNTCLDFLKLAKNEKNINAADELFQNAIEEAETPLVAILTLEIYANEFLYERKKDVKSAIQQYEDALKLTSQVPAEDKADKTLLQLRTKINLLKNYALFLMKVNQPQEALKKLEQALKIAYQAEEIDLIFQSNLLYTLLMPKGKLNKQNLQKIPFQNQSYTEEIQAFQLWENNFKEEAIKLLKRIYESVLKQKENNKNKIVRVGSLLASYLSQTENIAEAFKIIYLVADIPCKSQLYALITQADIQTISGDFINAIDTLQRGLMLAKKQLNNQEELTCYLLLSMNYRQNMQPDLALQAAQNAKEIAIAQKDTEKLKGIENIIIGLKSETIH